MPGSTNCRARMWRYFVQVPSLLPDMTGVLITNTGIHEKKLKRFEKNIDALC